MLQFYWNEIYNYLIDKIFDIYILIYIMIHLISIILSWDPYTFFKSSQIYLMAPSFMVLKKVCQG